MTETPEGLYKRLSEAITKQPFSQEEPQLLKLLNHYRAQVQVLREASKTIIDGYTYNTWDIKDDLKKALEATTDKWGE